MARSRLAFHSVTVSARAPGARPRAASARPRPNFFSAARNVMVWARPFARAGMLERPLQTNAAATILTPVFFMTSSFSSEPVKSTQPAGIVPAAQLDLFSLQEVCEDRAHNCAPGNVVWRIEHLPPRHDRVAQQSQTPSPPSPQVQPAPQQQAPQPAQQAPQQPASPSPQQPGAPVVPMQLGRSRQAPMSPQAAQGQQAPQQPLPSSQPQPGAARVQPGPRRA